MSLDHRKDSVREIHLKNKGITPPKDRSNVEQVRVAKKQEIGRDCSAAIYAGIDLDGKHYSLTEHDQTEMMAQAVKDAGAYVDHGLKVGVEGPAALVYFADLENQGGGGASARVAAAAKKPVTLDTMHAAGLADRVMGKYSTRRNAVYSAAKKLVWSGAAQASNGGNKI